MEITAGSRACVRPEEWLTCNKVAEMTDGSGMRFFTTWFFRTHPLAGVGSAIPCRPTEVSDSLRTAPNNQHQIRTRCPNPR